MHVTIIHRYFWPDTPPYASMLRSIAERLSQDGHAVEVVTTQPSYLDEGAPPARQRREQLGAIDVRRVRLIRERKSQKIRRGCNLVVFALAAAARIVRTRPDVAMAATTPPIVVAFAVSLACRITGCKFVYHNQDIYPEVMHPDGLNATGRLARRLDMSTARRATRVVVLSDEMEHTQIDRGVQPESLRVINNFDQDTFDAPTSGSDDAVVFERGTGARRIVFSGNVGRFQGVDLLVDAYIALGEVEGIELHVVGHGVELPAIRAQIEAAKRTDIICWGQVSAATAAEFVAASDLAVVTLRPGLSRYVYPSKTLTYLAAGTPILAVIEAESSLGRLVESAAIGLRADFTRASVQARLAEFCAMELTALEEMRRGVVDLHRTEFSRDRRLDDWSEMMSEMTSGEEAR